MCSVHIYVESEFVSVSAIHFLGTWDVQRASENKERKIYSFSGGPFSSSLPGYGAVFYSVL